MRYPVNKIAITQGFHTGKSLDFGYWTSHNQNIYSIDNGYVYKVEKQPNGGNVVYIKHPNGFISCYAHLDTIIVKKNQNVLLGEKIGTMGKSGRVTGEHLHLGIYSEGKNIYGNADINPFTYMQIYPNQEICKNANYKKYEKQILYLPQNNDLTKGEYRLIKSKAIRKNPTITNNIKKVGECTPLTQKYLTSKNPKDDAYLKIATDVLISNIIEDKEKRVWGQFGTNYIVLQDKKGIRQVIKLK